MEDSGAASGEKGVILSLFLSTESKAKLYNICGTILFVLYINEKKTKIKTQRTSFGCARAGR